MLLVRLFLLGVAETVRFGTRLGCRALRRIIFHNFRIPDVDDADGVRNGRRDTDRRRLRRCSRAGRTAPVRNPLVATGRGRHGLALAVTERVRMRHCVIEKKTTSNGGHPTAGYGDGQQRQLDGHGAMEEQPATLFRCVVREHCEWSVEE